MEKQAYLYVITDNKGQYLNHGYIDKGQVLASKYNVEKFENITDMIARCNQLNGANWFQEIYKED